MYHVFIHCKIWCLVFRKYMHIQICNRSGSALCQGEGSVYAAVDAAKEWVETEGEGEGVCVCVPREIQIEAN